MGKGSNSVKIEKIRRALEAGEFAEALELAKTVDAARLKHTGELSVMADAYYKNGAYDVALSYYEQIYQRSPLKGILVNMIRLCIRLSMADMAESYLQNFIQLAPKDYYRYVFRYQIDVLREEDIEVLIGDLEQIKEVNYIEEWAYELAKLYYRSGQYEKCVEECDDLILWFGSGTYVERARGLRAINMQGKGVPTEGDAELVREVYRLIAEGKSGEEVETFIEESTTPEGHSTGYTEEDYRNERYSEPVYKESGKEVEWNTTEFGNVTEETVVTKNTMDLLEGMQVARQIRMQLGENNEIEIAPVEAEEEPEVNEPEINEPEINEPEANEPEPYLPEQPVAPDHKNDEVEASLMQMLQDDEREEELSKAVREATESQEDEAETEQEIEPENAPPALYQYPKEVTAELTEEEAPQLYRVLQKNGLHVREFFAEYMGSQNLRKQLFRCVEQLLDSKGRNMFLIITGDKDSGKTALAKAIVKCVHTLGGMASSRVAVIDAQKLNHMRLTDKKEQLRSATLVIENAAEMDDAHMEELLGLTQDFNGTTGIILEDERSRMNMLLRKSSEMNGIYNNRVHLPKWMVEDLFLMALSLLALHDYQMDEPVAEKYLEEVRGRIEESRDGGYTAVHRYAEAVILRAQRRMAEQLRKCAREGRYQEADLQRLTEEDLQEE